MAELRVGFREGVPDWNDRGPRGSRRVRMTTTHINAEVL
jgi:hypothetical protein